MKGHTKVLLAIGLSLALNMLCSPISRGQMTPPSAKSYKFINGQWFDGEKFQRRLYYSVNGLLTKKMPLKIDETIDLQTATSSRRSPTRIVITSTPLITLSNKSKCICATACFTPNRKPACGAER